MYVNKLNTNFVFQDPAIITNQRRIGSGRIQHAKWSVNYPTQQQESNQHYHSKSSDGGQSDIQINGDEKVSGKFKLLQFFDNGNISNHDAHNTHQGISSNTVSNSVGTAGHQDDKIKDRTDFGSSNYVKRVVSGFLVVSNPKDREVEDKYEQQHKNHNEEPEWFSCGPTSRLDTIELCGFDEDEEHHSERNCSRLSREAGDGDLHEDDESKENQIQNANKVCTKMISKNCVFHTIKRMGPI